MRIAILDDDPVQLEHLVHTLHSHLAQPADPITVLSFVREEALRRALRRETFDLLLLDWNVRGLDGAALLKWLRTHASNETRVVMLSSRATEVEVAAALSCIDDYVIKPYRPIELCARIRRLARRVQEQPVLQSQVERFGAWWVDRAKKTLGCDATEGAPGTAVRLPLTERELRLAVTLMRNAGHVVSRGHLLDNAGYDGEKMSRLLDSHIYRLRAKLAQHSQGRLQLRTVYGQGYRLEVHEASAPSAAQRVAEPSPDERR